jgi:hypothetical protein
MVTALRPQTPKHIRGGWSHNTDTSESVEGDEAQNMVTVQSVVLNQEPFDHWPNALANCANLAHAISTDIH